MKIIRQMLAVASMLLLCLTVVRVILLPEAYSVSGPETRLTASSQCASGSFWTCSGQFTKPVQVKCINIDPANAGTDWLFWRTEGAITVTGIDCIVDAATSVVLTLRECNANGASCTATEAAMTCGTTNTTEASGIDDAAVAAGVWMRVLRGTVIGSPAQAVLCFSYTEP